MPIKASYRHALTGVRTPVGVKVLGARSCRRSSGSAREIESVLDGQRYPQRVRGASPAATTSTSTAAPSAGPLRADVEELHMVIVRAVGGMNVTHDVEGRERYPVDSATRASCAIRHRKARRVLVSRRCGGGHGRMPVGQLAGRRSRWSGCVHGARRADGFLKPAPHSLGLRRRRRAATSAGMSRKPNAPCEPKLPAARLCHCSGAASTRTCCGSAKLEDRRADTLVIIFLLLYFNFKSVGGDTIVMLALPFSAVGAISSCSMGSATTVFVALGDRNDCTRGDRRRDGR